MNPPRNESLKKSILSGFAGKGISSITQLLAIPASVSALGVEKFGIYLMIIPLFIWIIAASSILGNALTIAISEANAKKIETLQSEYFSSAFFPLIIGCIFISSLSLYFINAVDLLSLLNISNIEYMDEIYIAAKILAILIPINVFFTISEAVHAGLQKQYLNNILLALANIMIIIFLIIAIKFPSLPNVILAMFLPLTIFKFLNFIILITRNQHLVPSINKFNKKYLNNFIKTGSGFALMQIGSLGYQQFPIFFVGTILGPSYAAIMGVMMQLCNNFAAIVNIVTQPLLPAIGDAFFQKDVSWISKSIEKISKSVFLITLFMSLLMFLLGDSIISILLREEITLSNFILFSWCLYFFIAIYEHVGYTYLAGMNKIWLAAPLYTAGSLIVVICCYFLTINFGIKGVFISMIIGPMLTTVFSYPIIIRRQIKKLK